MTDVEIAAHEGKKCAEAQNNKDAARVSFIHDWFRRFKDTSQLPRQTLQKAFDLAYTENRNVPRY